MGGFLVAFASLRFTRFISSGSAMMIERWRHVAGEIALLIFISVKLEKDRHRKLAKCRENTLSYCMRKTYRVFTIHYSV